MSGRVSKTFVAEYLRTVGVDFVPRPAARRAPGGEERDAAAGRSGESLAEIRRELEECGRCPLCREGRTRIVFGVGNPRARLMFVGEGPGAEEDRQGEPFVGAAGKRLDRWIARIGLRRDDVYIANIVKCRPPGNRAPLPDEAAACLPFLKRQIRAIGPEVLCTLGAVALNDLLGVDERITRVRGRWREYEGIALLPTYHPAYVLRNPAVEHDAFEDFDRIAGRLGLSPAPAPPKG